MPIFISRFSPERSPAGNFLFVRSQRNADEAEKAPPQGKRRRSDATDPKEDGEKAGPQKADRVELSGRPDADLSEPSSASLRAAGPMKASRPREEGPPNAQADPRQQAEPASNGRNRQEPRAGARSRIGKGAPIALQMNASTVGKGVGTRAAISDFTAPAPAPRLAVRGENAEAGRNAAVKRLNALSGANEGEDDPAVTATAQPPQEEKTSGALESPAPPPAGRSGQGARPADLPPRKVQEQRLQQDVQTIAAGLRKDAAIENRRHADQTARNAQAAAEQGQRSEIRESQAEIRSLQAERRQLLQEAQRKDRAIRQLQSRTFRLQSRANTSVPPGTSLDLLLQ